LITRRDNISRIAGETGNSSFIDQTMTRPKSLYSSHNAEIVPRKNGIGAAGFHAAVRRFDFVVPAGLEMYPNASQNFQSTFSLPNWADTINVLEAYVAPVPVQRLSVIFQTAWTQHQEARAYGGKTHNAFYAFGHRRNVGCSLPGNGNRHGGGEKAISDTQYAPPWMAVEFCVA
jgi:hypothetical protein